MRRTSGVVAVLMGATLLVVTGAPPAAVAGGGTYSVTSGADAGSGSFREAIASAAAFGGPSTITFTTGLVVSLTGGDVVYTGAGALTLVGQGATIDGTDSQQLLRSTSAGVTVQDLTFTDAGSGAIEVSGAHAVTVTDSTFSSNQGSDGAAIETGTGPVTVSGSRFVGNTASVDGGAIDSTGGMVTVETSTFSGNTAGSDGGAIRTSTGDVAVSASTFTANVANGGEGGAIRTSSGDVVIDNSTFHANVAADAGGLVRASAPIQLDHVTASRNEAPEGAHVEWSGSGSLTIARTVLAEPRGGGTACSLGGATTSGTYNRVADTSCALTGTGDVQGASPTLGTLGANGGPTATRLPGTGLVDVIPVADCDEELVTDQRGQPRPGGDGCDVGAVEVDGERRPDGHLRNASQPTFVGNDVYNAGGVGQTRAQVRARGTTATFVLRLQNDGGTVDRIRLRGPGTSNRFIVRYRVGATTVTGAVVAGTHRTGLLAPGASALVTVDITPRAAAVRGSTTNFLLTARSDAALAVRDVVRASVRVA
jgi:predicted outer membrane repeat protein